MHKIKKIAENNVEVTYTKEMTDVNGKTFEVMAENEPESFGISGVTHQLAEIEKQIQYWSNSATVELHRQALLTKYNERKSLLLDVKKELEKK